MRSHVPQVAAWQGGRQQMQEQHCQRSNCFQYGIAIRLECLYYQPCREREGCYKLSVEYKLNMSHPKWKDFIANFN